MSLTLVGCNAANYDSKMTYYQLQSDLGKIKSSNTSFEKVNSELINSMDKYLLAQSQSFDRYYFCDEREYGDATAKILDGTTNKIVFTGPIFNHTALEFVAYELSVIEVKVAETISEEIISQRFALNFKALKLLNITSSPSSSCV